MAMDAERPITLALTGASGARYGLRLLEALLHRQQRVDLLLSDAARTVLQQECQLDIQGDGITVIEAIAGYFNHSSTQPVALAGLRHFGKQDWFAPLASGSSGSHAMVVCPCSMGTLAAIAHGLSDNLIERAADVVIKEQRQLILVPRETPFSAIHLENMLSLARLGVSIVPAAPGFYHRPTQIDDLIDFMVARILDQLGLPHTLGATWPNLDES